MVGCFCQGSREATSHKTRLEAKKICEALAKNHPHSEEYQILDRRVRLCGNVQKLAEMNAASLAFFDELELYIASLKDYWGQFPLSMKIKLVLTRNIQLLAKLSDQPLPGPDDKSGRDKIMTFCQTLVDCSLPHLGHHAFAPDDPSVSGLLADVFTTLNASVQGMSNQVGDDCEQMEACNAATKECQKALKDHD